MKFTDMLQHCWDVNQSLLCVGLDPDPKRFPKQFESNKHAILDFCWDIVKSTGDLVCAFKPQIAYFASSGAEDQLKELIARIHGEYPEVPVILDAKRGDIGSTAKHYAKEAFERFGADCVTLSPYMGFDSVEPYLEYPDKGAFILCRTSNKGGDDFQMLDCGGQPLYHAVAEKSRAVEYHRSARPCDRRHLSERTRECSCLNAGIKLPRSRHRSSGRRHQCLCAERYERAEDRHGDQFQPSYSLCILRRRLQRKSQSGRDADSRCDQCSPRTLNFVDDGALRDVPERRHHVFFAFEKLNQARLEPLQKYAVAADAPICF